MLHKPNFACSSSLLSVTKVLLNAVFDLFNKTLFFRQRNFVFSFLKLISANFIISAKIYRNYHFWWLCNVTQPKKEILFLTKKEILVTLLSKKGNIFCRSHWCWTPVVVNSKLLNKLINFIRIGSKPDNS